MASSLDVGSFLRRPLFAYLGTASPDGPRVSPVWFLWEGHRMWFIGNRRTDTFPLRIEAEPRCAVAIVDFDRHAGRVQHVGLRGRATIEPWDPDRAIRLFRRYLGENQALWDRERFVEPLHDPENLFVGFAPESTLARDQSYAASPELASPGG